MDNPTHLIRTPGSLRLDWLLAGLAGSPGWGDDAADVLAPEFTAYVAPERYVEITRQRAATCAPLTVVGIDIAGQTARARVRRSDGTIDVKTVAHDERATT